MALHVQQCASIAKELSNGSRHSVVHCLWTLFTKKKKKDPRKLGHHTSFTLNKRRRNCMLTMEAYFRSFKNMLTMKYILPFKDKSKLLKKPPTEYDFIDEENWNIFVINHSSDEYQVHM